jgi:hypothetical protein
MSFPTRKFSLELPTNSNSAVSIALIGASRSGKTTMMKHLYNAHFKKHITTMFTMNPHADIYKDFGTKILTCEEYFPELMREAHELNSLCDNEYPFCFISDDFVSTKIKHDAEVTKALTIYRNANISSIWSFQGRTLMSAVGRNQINYICVFKQQTPLEWTNVIKEFLSMWLPTGMSMREMIEFCKLATQDHQFFMIDNIVGECFISKLSKDQI